MEMHNLLRQLHLLQYSKFLNCQGEGNNLRMKLAIYGQKYRHELLELWKNVKAEKNIETIIVRENSDNHDYGEPKQRQFTDIALLGNDYFAKYSQKYQDLKQSSIFCILPILTVKSLISLSESKFKTFLNLDKTSKETILITDHFLNADQSLEKFYSLQRKRKIWWMRYSANPSRYSLEADHSGNSSEADTAQQTVSVKANFSNSLNIEMEQIMIVMKIRNKIYEENQPCVVRSVIPLERATSALLLDATDHKRKDLLRLNRKLAPYQCFISIVSKNSNPLLFNAGKQNDLRDLQTHLILVLKRAGLRVYVPGNLPENVTLYYNKNGKEDSLAVADRLGIPYDILIDENESLKTGFLKLRNRDTALSEIIHISDIPNYLLKIFHS